MEAPLYEQIYSYLLDEIRCGRLKNGDRVPSEKELAEQFDVSRITSKRALETLAQEKMIERVRGRGSFVSTDVARVAMNADVTDTQAIRSRSLESKKSWVIGVIVPDFSDSFGSAMVHAIERQCQSSNCHMMLRMTYGKQEAEEAAIQSMVQSGVDGLIVLPVHGEMYNAELLRLVLRNYPLILVDRHLKGIPARSVYTDNRKAAEQLTELLLNQGHEHIAFLSPPPEHTTTIEERIQGFVSAFSARGLRFNPNYLVTRLTSTLPNHAVLEKAQADAQILVDFIEARREVTAFVACEYNLAVLLSKTLDSIGKRIPSDYAVACFDSPEDPFGNHPFTHIRQNEDQIGSTALDLLLAQLRGETTVMNITVGYDLVLGRSTVEGTNKNK